MLSSKIILNYLSQTGFYLIYSCSAKMFSVVRCIKIEVINYHLNHWKVSVAFNFFITHLLESTTKGLINEILKFVCVLFIQN